MVAFFETDTRRADERNDTRISLLPSAQDRLIAEITETLHATFGTSVEVRLPAELHMPTWIMLRADTAQVAQALRERVGGVGIDLRQTSPSEIAVQPIAASPAGRRGATVAGTPPTTPAPIGLPAATASTPGDDRRLSRAGAGAPTGDSAVLSILGILPWEAFLVAGAALTAQAERRQTQLALVLIETDYPTFGLSDVDPVDNPATRFLVNIAQTSLRRADLIGLHGPRSLAVLASDVQLDGGRRLATRVQAALQTPGDLPIPSQPIQAVFGIATLPASGTTIWELLHSAESALREARQSTRERDRIISAPARIADADQPDDAGLAADVDELRAEAEVAVSAAADRVPGSSQAALAPPAPAVSETPDLPRPVATPAATSPDIPPIPVLEAAELEIPRRLRDAALFGSEPGSHCDANEAAEYLDQFPLLPFEPQRAAEPGEFAYLVRTATGGWEDTSGAGATGRGAIVPLRAPYLPWVRTLTQLPPFPGGALRQRTGGVVHLTNWRLSLADGERTVAAMYLREIVGVECFSDAVALTVAGRSERFVLLLRDALSVGLYIARAARDAGT